MNDLSASRYVLIQVVGEASEILRGIQPTSTSATVIKLIKSHDFWECLIKLVKTIEYPANIIGKLEADDAPLSMVYHDFGKLYNYFGSNMTVQDKIKKRLRFLFTDSMGLAYTLTPKYAAEGFYFDNDQIEIIGKSQQISISLY